MKALIEGRFKIKAALQLNYKVKYSKEGKWLIAEIPELNLATHAKTPKELEENLIDLVKDYMEDSHTPKPARRIQISFSRTYPRDVLFNVKTKTPIKA